MSLSTEHLNKCVKTLEQGLLLLESSSVDTIEYEIYRNATIKGFELTLETAGKLLRKSLKPFFALPKSVDEFMFKDVLRHAHKHGFLSKEEVSRWFDYRDNRNDTAHDYGIVFAEQTLKLIHQFIIDVKALEAKIS